MIKDTFFSAPRFVDLCRKDMVESWRPNVLRMVLMYGVMSIIMIWNGCFAYNSESYLSITDQDPTRFFILMLMVWGFFIFGCLSASFTMERMKSKTGRLSTLMVPATPFEKFFSRWLVSTVVFLIVFLISYKLADYTRVLIFILKYPDLHNIAPVDLSYLVKSEGVEGVGRWEYLFTSMNDFILYITVYLFGQSLFVLGSSVWPKNAFLKTFAAVVVIAIIYMLVAMGLATTFFTDGKNGTIGNSLSEEIFDNVISIVAVILAFVNWTIAYFRFKESEIINRM